MDETSKDQSSRTGYYGSLNDRVVIDPENNVAELLPADRLSKGANAKRSLVTTLVVAALAFFAVFGVTTTITSGVTVTTFITPSKDLFTDIMKEEYESGISYKYTLARKGYGVLPYFDSDNPVYLTYAILTDVAGILEPSADMTLQLVDTSEDTEYSYRYRVCDNDNSQNCFVGEYAPSNNDKTTYINVPCRPNSKYTVSVSEMDMSGDTVSSEDFTALCMYVRREISTLTPSDLEATMDAMYTLWSVSDAEGQDQFGSDFHSASYFAAAHDFNAAQRDADHIHEGLGFLPQHLKLTNMYEKAIQAVNPAISLPYWDFTKDVAQNLTIFESLMFTEDTFGSMKQPTDSYWGFTYRDDSLQDTYILDGRWANLQAEQNTRFPGLSSGFGYMRGPWNMNPNPHVSRFAAFSPSLPSCSDYYGGIGMTDFLQFLETAPYGSHASTHGVIGGVFGCDKMDTLRESGIIKDEDSQLAICKKWGFYMKELYRSNYLSPQTDCTADSALSESGISCGFECNSDTYDLMPTQIQSIINSDYLKKSMTSSDYEVWREFICDGDGYRVFVGDHLESASPSDPSFWPIHPTLERLLQVKMMVYSFGDDGTGGFSWPTDAVNDYVCDKSKCYEESYGSKGYYEECCYGHFENDQLLDFINGDTSSYTGDTNAQVMSWTDPTSMEYGMTYIYDNFDWSHCNEDFASKLDDMYSEYGNNDNNNNNNNKVDEVEVDEEDEDEEDENENENEEEVIEEEVAMSDPTASPTHSPKPTHRPTKSPTKSPVSTRKPTHSPTAAPSVKRRSSTSKKTGKTSGSTGKTTGSTGKSGKTTGK